MLSRSAMYYNKLVDTGNSHTPSSSINLLASFSTISVTTELFQSKVSHPQPHHTYMAWWQRKVQSPTRQSPDSCGGNCLPVKRSPLSKLPCDSNWRVVAEIPELDNRTHVPEPTSPTSPLSMASAPGHPSRQDNKSTSSNHSTSQRSERGGRSHTHVRVLSS